MEDDQAAIDAVLKFTALALVVGALLGLVTFVLVKALGVGGGGGGPGNDPAAIGTPSALPTVALSDPGTSASASSSPSESPSESPSTKAPERGALKLDASPAQVAPGERINLTGTYQGEDNVTLQVQRKTGGDWGQFADVTVPVRTGSFATYVITQRTGEQTFRVYDVGRNKGSNPVKVTVGG